MNINVINENLNLKDFGRDMVRLVSRLYPICRSITGNGVRNSLNIIKELIPLQVCEIPTGTKVFDWTVPKEWNIKDAYIRDSNGRKVVDFNECNLHVMSYSIPVSGKLKLDTLKPHLFSLPDHPEWIPYRTSYYNESWGFCLKHRQLMQLKEGEYEVVIDSTLEDGYLTYGEYFIPGSTSDEILISTHLCHPSLVNDNLSGIAVCALLARIMSGAAPRYSYRFLFIPGTIGSITWLFLHQEQIHHIKHGLVAACLGDDGGFTYKRTRSGRAEVDRSVEHVLRFSATDSRIIDFVPYGYDERQYNSPGINLPVGCLMRTPNGRYPEYHTSADNLTLVSPSNIAESLQTYLNVFSVLEGNRKYLNLNPKCEPQLGRRGLYDVIGGREDGREFQMALLWVLNFSDGSNMLLDIAERAGIHFNLAQQAADALIEAGLLKEIDS